MIKMNNEQWQLEQLNWRNYLVITTKRDKLQEKNTSRQIKTRTNNRNTKFNRTIKP